MKTTNRKRTKILSMLLTVVMMFGVFASTPFTVSAATTTDGFEYEEVSEYAVYITGYNGKKTNVVIPEKIDGLMVLGISENAFKGNKTIKSIKLSDTVLYVEKGAFQDCVNLNEIYFSEYVISVGENVCKNTAYYKDSTNWVDEVLYINTCMIEVADRYAESVNIKSGTTIIADEACSAMYNLTYCEIPEGVIYIGWGSFSSCENLEEIVLPETLLVIGDAAFSSSFGLKKVNFPKNLVSIGGSAFDCCGIKEIKLPDNIVHIGNGAFAETGYYYDQKNWHGTGLYIGKYLVEVFWDNAESIDIKKGTVLIADYVANNINTLKSVTIPYGVKIIGEGAFFDCPNVKEIAVPSSVESIGWGAFGLTKKGDTYYRYADFKLIGIKGSLAEEYAKAFGLEFVDGSKATSVKLNKKSFKLGVGEIYTLEMDVIPNVAGEVCKWSSSDKSVATVNSKGVVTGKKSGTATITLKSANGKTATCKVTVYKAPSSIKLDRDTLTLAVGDWLEMGKTVNSGAFVNGPSLTWTSSDNNVVTVKRIAGAKCQITAVGTGTATVTVKTYNGKTATCKVTIKKAVTKTKLSQTKVNLGVGESFIVSRSAVNDDEYLTPENASWGSNFKDIAKVKKMDDNKAEITGVSVGNAVITAIGPNGIRDKVKVTVKKAPSKITLNKKSIKLGVGETHELTSTIAKDEFVNNRNITWSSSNKKVVTVKRESNGKAVVTAVGTGTATITVKTYNGKTATCKVTVYKAPSNVYLDKTKINLGVGEKFELSRSVNSGAFVNGPSLTWTSSDKNIMKVKAIPGAKGEVTGASVGTATVTVETYNGKTATCKVTVHKAPSAITLNKSSISLKKGKSYELTSAIAKGEFLNNRNINWSSSNTKVVTVKR